MFYSIVVLVNEFLEIIAIDYFVLSALKQIRNLSINLPIYSLTCYIIFKKGQYYEKDTYLYASYIYIDTRK